MSPRARTARWAVGLLLATLWTAGGCSPSTGSAALDALRAAPLTPGRGLGEITLGQSLESVTARLGVARVVTIVGDEYYVELQYPRAGLALLFDVRDGCRAALLARGRPPELLRGLEDPEAFFRDFPDCRGAPLGSLAVSADAGDDAWFTGATPRGIRLGTPRDELLAAGGIPVDLPEPLAAAGPEDQRFDRIAYSEGYAAFLGAGREGEPWTVQRLTVFAPPFED